MIRIWKLSCVTVVVTLLLSLLALPVFAAEPPNSATPPEGYQPEPTAETYANASKYVITDGDAEALLIQDENPWGYTSNVDALNELGISYDLINSNQVAGRDLSEYKFIMYASNQSLSYYNNLEDNIDKIEEYVSGGGLLIAHVCDNTLWDGLDILPGGVNKVRALLGDLKIVDRQHPVIAGTPSGTVDIYDLDPDYFDGWNYSTHGYFTNPPAGYDKVIEIEGGDSDGKPTYIDYSFGRGTVLATMQTVEWGYERGWPELLRNELRYGAAFRAGRAPRPLVANFSATPTMGQAPLTVSFRDTSTGDIDTRFWNFGDGNTARTQFPTNVYMTEGIYRVTLTVTGPNGTTSRKSVDITVESETLAPNLVVRNVTITPVYAKPRQAITITAGVFNAGGAWGSQTTNLTINGQVEQSVPVGVAAGTEQAVSFTVYKTTAGTYQVGIDGATATFYVQAEETATPQAAGLLAGGALDTTGTIAIVVIAVVILAGIVFAILLTRRA